MQSLGWISIPKFINKWKRIETEAEINALLGDDNDMRRMVSARRTRSGWSIDATRQPEMAIALDRIGAQLHWQRTFVNAMGDVDSQMAYAISALQVRRHIATRLPTSIVTPTDVLRSLGCGDHPHLTSHPTDRKRQLNIAFSKCLRVAYPREYGMQLTVGMNFTVEMLPWMWSVGIAFCKQMLKCTPRFPNLYPE